MKHMPRHGRQLWKCAVVRTVLYYLPFQMLKYKMRNLNGLKNLIKKNQFFQQNMIQRGIVFQYLFIHKLYMKDNEKATKAWFLFYLHLIKKRIYPKILQQLHIMNSQTDSFWAYQDFMNELKSFDLYSNITKNSLLSLTYVKKKSLNKLQEIFKINFDFRDYLLIVEPPTKQSCQSLIKDKVYICHDCQLHIKGFLCENCFFKAEHHITCRFTIQQLEQKFHNQLKCSCGDYQSICYRGTCSNHHKILKKEPPKGIIAEKFYKYVLGCFQLQICAVMALKKLKKECKNKSAQYSKTVNEVYFYFKNVYGGKLLQQLSELNKKTSYFLAVIQQSLLSLFFLDQNDRKIQEDYHNKPILKILLGISNPQKFQTLTQSLLFYHSEVFLKSFINSIFNLHSDSQRANWLEILKMLVLKQKVELQSFYSILCSLHGANKLTIANCFDFYSQIANPQKTKKQQLKPIFCLTQCWKQLHRGQKIIFNCFLYRSKIQTIFSILRNTVYDSPLFIDIIVDLAHYIASCLEKKYVQKKIEQEIDLGKYCNNLSQLIYFYLQGDQENLVPFLTSLKIEYSLVQIIFYYFFQSVNQPSMLSQQSVYMFGLYLHKLKLQKRQEYESYCINWIGLSFQPQKLFQFSLQGLNIVFGQQLKRLAKLTSLKQVNPHERLELEKMQQKVLQQMVNIDPQPKSLVLKMLGEKILNFPRAHQIYEKLMKDKAQHKSRPKLHFCDSLFNIIFCLDQQVENVTFTPEATDGLGEIEFGYRANIVREVLAPIFSTECDELFNQLDRKSMKMIKLNQEYVKWLSFTIIDKMAGGSIPKLREQLKLKKQKVENAQTKRKTKYLSEQLWVRNLFMKQKTQGTKSQDIVQVKQSKTIESKRENIHEKQKKNSIEQKCISCKQIGIPGYSLFHLGLLKKNNEISPLKIVFPHEINSQYQLQMCSHLMHQQCFIGLCKSNSFSCPACKMSANIAFPSLSEIPNEVSIQFMQNRLIYVFTQTFLEYHPPKWYLLFTNIIISQLSLSLFFGILKNGQNFDKQCELIDGLDNKKGFYFWNLLKIWIESLEQGLKLFFLFLIKRETKNWMKQSLIQQKRNNPKLVFDEIVFSMILIKFFRQNQQESIRCSLKHLQRYLSSNQLKRAVKLIQSFLLIDLNIKFEQKNEGQKKLLHSFLSPPPSLIQLQHTLNKCSKCSKGSNTSVSFCLICQKSYCPNCAHLKNHIKTVFRLNTKTTQLEYSRPNGSIRTVNIYENSFKISFCINEKNSNMNYFKFNIDYQLFNEHVWNWISHSQQQK